MCKIMSTILCFLLCFSLHIPIVAKEEEKRKESLAIETSYQVEKVYKNAKLVYQLFPKELEMETKKFLFDEMNELLKEQILNVSHFGYEEEIRNSEEWYKATQFYIWESLGLRFNTDDFKEYATYKEAIQSRIDAAKPSFIQNKLTFIKNKTIDFIDTNKKLHEFILVENAGVIASIKEDTLCVSLKDNLIREGNITLKKEEIFKGLDIMVSLEEEEVLNTDTFIQSVSIPYRIQSYGFAEISIVRETLVNASKVSTPYGDLYSSQNEFIKLYDEEVVIYANEDIYDVWGNLLYLKDQVVDVFKCSENSIRKLVCGNYYVKNNTDMIPFAIEEEKNSNVVIYKNRPQIEYVFKQEIEKCKNMEINGVYQHMKYGIYTKEDMVGLDGSVLIPKDSLVYLSCIDENGYLLENIDLMEGNYYLKQVESHEMYELNDTVYEFSVSDATPVIYLAQQGMLTSILCRSDMTIFNTSKDHKDTLVSTFVLYDQNMEEVSTFTTNTSGNYVVDNLVHGIYYLKEKDIQEGYKFKGEIEKIEFNENEIVHVENEAIVSTMQMVNTNDTSKPRFWEAVMVGSMSIIYIWLLKRLKL